MALTITQALMDRWDASGLTDFARSVEDAGGLWLEEIPATVTPKLPLAGLTHQGEQLEYTFENDYFETGSFEFSIYGLGVAETERLGLAVKAAFDPCIKSPQLLTITDAKVISFSRTGGQIGVEGYRQADGKAVGRATFVYDYTVQRKLP